MRTSLKNQSGSILLSIIITLPFIILIAALYTELTISGLGIAKRDQSRTHAQLATDAGIDAGMEQINTVNNWPGSVSQVEVHNDGKVKTTYQTSVVNDGSNKSLISTGRTFRPATASQSESDVTVTVKLREIKAGQYSVVSGVGGLFMQNSAKILGGDVFINGEISMQNSAQIGLTTNPVNVRVAHQNCPNPATASYPRLCATGENGQPISITNPANIYGSVYTNNQTNGNRMTNPGLVASSGVTAQPLPTHNRTQQKANITTTTGSSYYTSCSANNTTRNWPSRLKIVGDVTIEKSCNIILEGDVWITGNLTLKNSATITTANGITLGDSNTVDADQPTIMVDGSAGVVLQQSGSLLSNNNSLGMQVITYASRATCSPDCSDVTGVDLYNSRNDKTIQLQNSAQAPNSILYARWTQAEMANGGAIGAVIGQTIRLSNSASITFGASTGAEGASYWVIDNYRRTFN